MKYLFDNEYIEQLVRLTCDLVNRPTENKPPFGDEAAGTTYLKGYFRDLGLETDEYSPSDLPEYTTNPLFLKRDFKGRYNLDAYWKGSGEGKSLLLSGHIDVAPKEPMPWTVTQPFTALVKDGRIYGRGSADMKGGLACAILAVKMLREKGFMPRGDVILEAVVDEEFAGSNGTLAGRLRGHNADFAINMEPTGLDVCPACVGAIILKVTADGVAGMPYTGGKSTNCAYDMADILHLIKQYGEKRELIAAPEIWKSTVQGIQLIMMKVKSGEVDGYGQLSLPKDAWCEFVIQYYPGEDVDGIINDLTQYLKNRFHDPAILHIEQVYHDCLAASNNPSHPGVQLLADCVKKNAKSEGCIRAAMFSCDMEMFIRVGKMPTVVFGPKGGQLHAPDEWVSINSLIVCTQSIADFIVKWCG
jgi:acetylornithine deacetylase